MKRTSFLVLTAVSFSHPAAGRRTEVLPKTIQFKGPPDIRPKLMALRAEKGHGLAYADMKDTPKS